MYPWLDKCSWDEEGQLILQLEKILSEKLHTFFGYDPCYSYFCAMMCLLAPSKITNQKETLLYCFVMWPMVVSVFSTSVVGQVELLGLPLFDADGGQQWKKRSLDVRESVCRQGNKPFHFETWTCVHSSSRRNNTSTKGKRTRAVRLACKNVLI